MGASVAVDAVVVEVVPAPCVLEPGRLRTTAEGSNPSTDGVAVVGAAVVAGVAVVAGAAVVGAAVVTGAAVVGVAVVGAAEGRSGIANNRGA